MFVNIFLYIISPTFVILLLIKLYQKLKCGICKSSLHLVGKVVIVTGANGGLGFETARDLAERGAKVLLACRSEERGTTARDEIVRLTGNENIHYRHLDLGSIKSIREFADEIIKTERRLDVLINNAAVHGLGDKKSEDCLNLGLQINYFGPFLLTGLLLPLMKCTPSSRIVNVSSSLHYLGFVDFNNLNMEKKLTDYLVYSNSKLFINLMTLELSRRLKGSDVTVNCLHPGVSGTNILDDIPIKILRSSIKLFYKMLFKTTWEAAQTSIYLAVSPEVKGVSGLYFTDCEEASPSKKSLDSEIAQKLWTETEKLVNFQFED